MRSGYEPITRLPNDSLIQFEVSEDKPVSLDRDPCFDRNLAAEHRPLVRERMKLAALAAWIDRRGKLIQQRRVEVAPGEPAIELLRIDARDSRAEASANHRSRKRRRRAVIVV